MKAIGRFSARYVLAGVTIGIVFTVSACSQEKPQPAPRPAARPVPAAPAAAPQPRPPAAPIVRAPAKWMDAPQTPGTWRWSMEGARSVARFGADLLVLSCNRDAAAVTLTRFGPGEGQVPMTVSTSAFARPLGAVALPGPPPSLEATISARDSLLDAMAFSRGRFAVETPGLPTLYVPSWPEVARVVEDCR
jgi:hypothetical protein